MENANGRGHVPHRQPPNMSFCRIFLLSFVFCIVTILQNYQIQITIKINEPPSKHGSDRKLAAENKDVYHSRREFESNYTDMEANFKIYAYPTYNEEDDNDEAMKYSKEGKKDCEWYFLKNLKENSFVTDNPDEAHFFFVPLSNHRMLQQVASEKELGFLVEKYIHHLISEYPYWNRTLGSDHFFVSCDKIDIRAIENIQSLIENSTRLVCSPSYKSAHNDVSIPSVSAPFKGQHKEISIKKRKRIVDDSDLFGKASSIVRLSFNNLQNNESSHLYNNVQTQRDDRFCVCLGPRSKPTSGCIVSSIHHKCVPVFESADYYDLPFREVLDWRKFSVIVRDYQVPFLGIILNVKSGKRYEALYQNLLKVRRHFEWNSDALSYDAFHMALYDLWMRRKAVEDDDGEVF